MGMVLYRRGLSGPIRPRHASARSNSALLLMTCPAHDQPRGLQMTHITYEIVEHDGGWAYRVDGVVSETFPSHDAARRAAERAAREQRGPGNMTGISDEAQDGGWHDDLSVGHE